MQRDALGAWLQLAVAPGIGNATARKLMAQFGLPESILAQPTQSLRTLLSAAQLQSLIQPPPAFSELLEASWNWLHAAGSGPARNVVTLADANYPQALLQTEDPPLLLWALGILPLRKDLASSTCPSIAVVGSRNPTAQGSTNARQLSDSLAQAGLLVVSGMALGIDGAAHEGALQAGGRTIAVVGTGLDRVYPRQHRELAHRIAENGLLLSEFPLGTPPLMANFPRRNRIIAGLGLGTLVVEAALQSGSLITARMALEQGREVFAVPGSIHSPQSKGCHALIRQGAKLVETAQDVLEELQLDPQPQSASDHDRTVTDESCLSTTHAAVLEALGFDPASFDALQARSGIPTPELQAALLELELDNRVARLAGGLFQQIGLA